MSNEIEIFCVHVVDKHDIISQNRIFLTEPLVFPDLRMGKLLHFQIGKYKILKPLDI